MPLITDKYQVGLSPTTSQNFTLSAPNSGAFKISRGNVGATTLDILNIDIDGYVTTPTGVGIGTTPTASEKLAIQTLQSDPVYGTNILSNGNFASGSTGWTVGAGWVVSGGQATSTGTGTLSTTVTVVSGLKYQINIGTWTGTDVYVSAGTALVSAYIHSSAKSASFVSNVTGSITISFVPVSATSTSITNFSVVQIISSNVPVLNFKDQSGIVSNQIRIFKKLLNNTASGLSALQNNTAGFQNTANGVNALQLNTTGFNNSAFGLNTLLSNTTGFSNSATGVGALQFNTTGYNNSATGGFTLYLNTTGFNNTASGLQALYSNTTGSQNSATGYSALYLNTTGFNNTASGTNALYSNTTFSNVMGLGYNAQVTASNQVQLGDSTTTTYVYGTVANRSDIRDKADVRDTVLGLDFINALRPVDYKWDMREDYKPEAPVKTSETDEEFKVIQDAWLEAVKLDNIVHDGSKKRNRYHHGLIAQEVEEVIASTGIDFGGLQDHKKSEGQDVLSIGYDELIAPLIKSIQELTARIKVLEAKK